MQPCLTKVIGTETFRKAFQVSPSQTADTVQFVMLIEPNDLPSYPAALEEAGIFNRLLVGDANNGMYNRANISATVQAADALAIFWTIEFPATP